MSQGHRTAFNVICVSAATLLQIINQFIFMRILSVNFGAEQDAEAYNAAMIFPMVAVAIVTGSLAYVFVPELVSKFEQEGDAVAWQLASYIGLVFSACCGLVTLVFLLGAEQVCGLYELLDGRPISEQATLTEGQLQQRIGLLRILSLQVVLTGIISWAQAVHHSRHHFLLPAMGGVLGTGLTFVLAYLFGKNDISVIAWSVNAGSVLSLFIHVVSLAGRLAVPRADASNLLRLLNLFWPLLLGTAVIRLDPLVDRLLADSLNEPGAITYVHYSQRILAALLAIGTSSLAVIAFPQLAQRLTAEGHRGFAEHFALALRRTLLIVFPISIGLSVFAGPVISDLLEGGQWTENDTAVVSSLIVAMVGMFLGASTGELLARGFYVLGNTRTPTFIGVIALALGLIVKILLVQTIGILGIGIGVSFYFMTSATIMAIVLARRVDGSIFEGVLLYSLQATLASLIACGCCQLVYSMNWGSSWTAAPVGAVTYLCGLICLRNKETLRLLRTASRKTQVFRSAKEK